MYDYIHIKYMRNNNCENSCYLHGVIIMRTCKNAFMLPSRRDETFTA